MSWRITSAVLLGGALFFAPQAADAQKPKKADTAEKEEASEGDKGGKGEKKTAGADAAAKPADGAPGVKTQKTDKEGVKTFTFGPVEVEGRLKSPQIIYFLRRVRAEFAAGDLGHRSFLRELSDTRRSPALR